MPSQAGGDQPQILARKQRSDSAILKVPSRSGEVRGLALGAHQGSVGSSCVVSANASALRALAQSWRFAALQSPRLVPSPPRDGSGAGVATRR